MCIRDREKYGVPLVAFSEITALKIRVIIKEQGCNYFCTSKDVRLSKNLFLLGNIRTLKSISESEEYCSPKKHAFRETKDAHLWIHFSTFHLQADRILILQFDLTHKQ